MATKKRKTGRSARGSLKAWEEHPCCLAMDNLLAYGTEKVDRLLAKNPNESCARHLQTANKQMDAIDEFLQKGNWSRAIERFPSIFEKIGLFEACAAAAPPPRAKTPPRPKTKSKPKVKSAPKRVSPRAARKKAETPRAARGKSQKMTATKSPRKTTTPRKMRTTSSRRTRTPVRFAEGEYRKWGPGDVGFPYKAGDTIKIVKPYSKVPAGMAKVTTAKCAGKVPMVGISYRNEAGQPRVGCIPIDVTKKAR